MGEAWPAREYLSVIARFEEDASLIAELGEYCDKFRTLCEEHALATEVVERCRQAEIVNDPTFFDYLQIIRDLEHEIASMLANEKRSLRYAASKRSAAP